MGAGDTVVDKREKILCFHKAYWSRGEVDITLYNVYDDKRYFRSSTRCYGVHPMIPNPVDQQRSPERSGV